MADNESGSSHSARDTLDRILQENRIRADGRLIRGSHPVVCLSERTPDELVADRRFRPALSRWEFEPVAIGLGLEHCLALGFKPVRYRPEAEYDKLPSEDRPYFQKSQPGALETEHEREWRALGDINLAAIPYAAQFLFDHGLCVPRSEL